VVIAAPRDRGLLTARNALVDSDSGPGERELRREKDFFRLAAAHLPGAVAAKRFCLIHGPGAPASSVSWLCRRWGCPQWLLRLRQRGGGGGGGRGGPGGTQVKAGRAVITLRSRRCSSAPWLLRITRSCTRKLAAAGRQVGAPPAWPGSCVVPSCRPKPARHSALRRPSSSVCGGNRKTWLAADFQAFGSQSQLGRRPSRYRHKRRLAR